MKNQQDRVLFHRLPAGFALVLALCLLVLSVAPRSAQAQTSVAGNRSDLRPCGCGEYVALKQFPDIVTRGTWLTAESMADQLYWNSGYVQYSRSSWQRSWRYRIDVPQAGDVMIMQGGSPFWLETQSPRQTAPVGEGHAGIVLRAAYDASRAGWNITLKSANWGGYDWAASTKTYTDGKCTNVNEVKIFVPNGDSVSFWREIKSPILVAILPTTQANSRALAVSADPSKRPAVVQAVLDARSEEQIWVVETLPEGVPLVGTNYVRIINYKTGNCLDVSGGSSNNGAPIIEWRCHNGDNQKWQLLSAYGVLGGIRSKLSGKLLDVPGGTQTANVQIIQWEQNGGSNQQWKFRGVVQPGSMP